MLSSLPDAGLPLSFPEQTPIGTPVNLNDGEKGPPYWIRTACKYQTRELIVAPPRYIKIHVCWASPIPENSEKFWLKVITSYRLWLDAVIDNELHGFGGHGLKKGDLMRLNADEVWDIIQ
jgi:hypothetical protein